MWTELGKHGLAYVSGNLRIQRATNGYHLYVYRSTFIAGIRRNELPVRTAGPFDTLTQAMEASVSDAKPRSG